MQSLAQAPNFSRSIVSAALRLKDEWMDDNFKNKRKGDRDNTPSIRFFMMFLTVIASLMTISTMMRAFGGAAPFTFTFSC